MEAENELRQKNLWVLVTSLLQGRNSGERIGQLHESYRVSRRIEMLIRVLPSDGAIMH